jgi:hypothetical protein
MSWLLYAILAIPLAAVAISLLFGWRVARVATVLAAALSFAITIAIAIEVEHGATITTAHSWIRVDSLRDGGGVLRRLPRGRPGAPGI